MTDYAELEKRLREMNAGAIVRLGHTDADDPHNSADLTHDEASLVREAADAILSLHNALVHIYELAEQGECEPVPCSYLHSIRERALEALGLSRAPAEQVQGQGEK